MLRSIVAHLLIALREDVERKQALHPTARAGQGTGSVGLQYLEGTGKNPGKKENNSSL